MNLVALRRPALLAAAFFAAHGATLNAPEGSRSMPREKSVATLGGAVGTAAGDAPPRPAASVRKAGSS